MKKTMKLFIVLMLMGSGMLQLKANEYSQDNQGENLPEFVDPSFQYDLYDDLEEAIDVESIPSEEDINQDDVINYLNWNEITRQAGVIGFEEVDLLSDDEVSIIVEFVELPDALKEQTGTSAYSLTEDVHDVFRNSLQQILNSGAATTFGIQQDPIIHEYNYAFKGSAAVVPASSIEQIANLDEVQAVYLNYEVQITDEEMAIAKENAIEQVTSFAATLSNPKGMSQERSYLGVDSLHNQGYKGKGVTIAILDTGIDYNHPDLKNAFLTKSPTNNAADLKNGKFYGRNFVKFDATMKNYGLPARAANDPMETTYTDYTNSTDAGISSSGLFYTSHGTHVAGIIAGRGVNGVLSTRGVAPESNIYTYRVLGPYGSGYVSWILAAIDQVAIDKPNIVNMSLGSGNNNAKTIETIAINNIMLANPNIQFAIAAGNSGPGPFTVGDPGTSTLATTVGNGYAGKTNGIITATSGSSYDLIELYNGWNSEFIKQTDGTYISNFVGDNGRLQANGSHQYKVYTLPSNGDTSKIGTGTTSDFNNAGASFRSNIKNNVLVIMRPSSMSTALYNAYQAGVGMLIIISDSDANFSLMNVYRNEYWYSLPTYGINSTNGQKLLASIKANGNLFKVTNQKNVPGNTLNTSSSRGPSADTFEILPDLVAPGTSVYSTVPYYMYNYNNPNDYRYAYQRKTGTSMATPVVVGTMALMKQYSNTKGLGWSSYDIRSKLADTASKYGSYGVTEIGAGFINPQKAMNSTTTIYSTFVTNVVNGMKTARTATMSFGMLPTGVKNSVTKQLYIKNETNVQQTYKISYTFNTQGQLVENPSTKGVTFALSSTTIVVPAKTTKTVNVTMTAPATTTSSDEGSYEGIIKVVNSANANDAYTMPFSLYLKSYVEAATDLFLGQSVISGNASIRQMPQSSSTALYYRLRKPYKSFDILISNDANPGKIIGIARSRIDISNANQLGTLYVLTDAIKSTYYPAVYNSNGALTGFSSTPKALANGMYQATIIARGTTQIDQYQLPFYVDNTAPSLVLNNYNSTYNTVYYPAGSSTVTISGTLIDKSVQTQVNNGVLYELYGVVGGGSQIPSQSKNALFVKIGSTYQRVNVGTDGWYGITVPSTTKSITLYGISNYNLIQSTSTYPVTMTPTFTPTAALKASGPYGWVGVNMVTKTINIDINKPTLNITPTSTTISVKNTLNLSAVFNTLAKGDSVVSWTSNNTKVATVSTTGKVTGIAPGTATITVKSKNGLTATSTITVVKNVSAGTTLNAKDLVQFGEYDHLLDFYQNEDGSIVENSQVYEGVKTPIVWEVQGHETTNPHLTMMSKYVIDAKSQLDVLEEVGTETSPSYFKQDAFLKSFTTTELSAIPEFNVEMPRINLDGSINLDESYMIEHQQFYLPWSIQKGQNKTDLQVFWSARVENMETTMASLEAESLDEDYGYVGQLKNGRQLPMLVRSIQDVLPMTQTNEVITEETNQTDILSVETQNDVVQGTTQVDLSMNQGFAPITKIEQDNIVAKTLLNTDATPIYGLTILSANDGEEVGSIGQLDSDARFVQLGSNLEFFNLDVQDQTLSYGYKVTQTINDIETIVLQGTFKPSNMSQLVIPTDQLAFGDYTVYVWLEKAVNISTKAAGVVYQMPLQVNNGIDKTHLMALIDQATSVTEQSVTPESFLVLKNALNEALMIYENYVATQEEVDDIITMLSQALAQLDYLVNGLNLSPAKELLDTIQSLNAKDYTVDSWQKLMNAKLALEAIIDSAATGTYTQDDVDAAYQKVLYAFNHLVKESGNQLPATGQTSFIPVAFIILGVGLTLIVKKRKISN